VELDSKTLSKVWNTNSVISDPYRAIPLRLTPFTPKPSRNSVKNLWRGRKTCSSFLEVSGEKREEEGTSHLQVCTGYLMGHGTASAAGQSDSGGSGSLPGPIGPAFDPKMPAVYL